MQETARRICLDDVLTVFIFHLTPQVSEVNRVGVDLTKQQMKAIVTV